MQLKIAATRTMLQAEATAHLARNDDMELRPSAYIRDRLLEPDRKKGQQFCLTTNAAGDCAEIMLQQRSRAR
ncbi:hypothetical protein I3J27_20645 [Bradyrhizobium xenonodulans]|uniref:Transposase n=1 Tax=Bradyrhizobium xenonodulans TaxID=2736875 RepID=A0ABY7MB35_9BRAD|nr:hypothetical protein [Bradyrhizobium xenonodulans]WBL75455.1 hypothetical protein I3J27_20645 [Bradyrhizobium xenonodulans]